MIRLVVKFSGIIEEHEASVPVRGDLMQKHFHFNPANTSAPVVDRVAVRMFLEYPAENGWNM